MAIICMAVHDTVENKRTNFTLRTLESLYETVDFGKHRLVIIDNGSCELTKEILQNFKVRMRTWREVNVRIITNAINIGTAAAINQGLKLRSPEEYAVKMDNDVVFNKANWIEEMHETMMREPEFGILGLKRRDCTESIYSIDTNLRSKIIEVKRNHGDKWYYIEECKHVMGTCTMLSPALLCQIGYFFQHGLYGFDDSLLCARSKVAGFRNGFLVGVDIEHIDPGGDEYTEWKSNEARKNLNAFVAEVQAYESGAKTIYYNPFETPIRITFEN
jgi:GT2 family glycosyltransferase